MSLASCQKCKKLFQKVRKNICPACEAAEEDYYEIVRKFLSENPGHNVEQVSEATGVPVDTVLRFVSDGRIEAQGIAMNVPCGQCGQPAISATKRLCQACLEKLNAQIARQQSRIKLPDKKEVDVGKALNTFRVPMKGTNIPGSGTGK